MWANLSTMFPQGAYKISVVSLLFSLSSHSIIGQYLFFLAFMYSHAKFGFFTFGFPPIFFSILLAILLVIIPTTISQPKDPRIIASAEKPVDFIEKSDHILNMQKITN